MKLIEKLNNVLTLILIPSVDFRDSSIRSTIGDKYWAMSIFKTVATDENKL